MERDRYLTDIDLPSMAVDADGLIRRQRPTYTDKPMRVAHGPVGANESQYLRKEKPMEAVERKAFNSLSPNQVRLLDGLLKAGSSRKPVAR